MLKHTRLFFPHVLLFTVCYRLAYLHSRHLILAAAHPSASVLAPPGLVHKISHSLQIATFCPTSGPKPQVSSFTVTNDEEKRRMLTFKKLEPGNVWCSSLKKDKTIFRSANPLIDWIQRLQLKRMGTRRRGFCVLPRPPAWTPLDPCHVTAVAPQRCKAKQRTSSDGASLAWSVSFKMPT